LAIPFLFIHLKEPLGALLLLGVSELWQTRLMRGYGTMLHKAVRRTERRQFSGTFFFRNRPQLQLMRRLIAEKPAGATLDIAILACSIGAEIHSILSIIRGARPALGVHVLAVDNSGEVLQVARRAVRPDLRMRYASAFVLNEERLTQHG
jgi:chemotaxis methyl-accepting protein methylase